MFQDELQTKSKNDNKNVSVYMSVESPEQDLIIFNIPVIIVKKNQINAQGLKNS